MSSEHQRLVPGADARSYQKDIPAPPPDTDDDKDCDTTATERRTVLASALASAPALFALLALFSALVVWISPLSSSYASSTSATPSTSSSSYLLGSTGMAPPYVTRGIPSTPSVLDAQRFNSDPSPLSDMSPAELGFPNHVRDKESSPGRVFGSLILGGQGSGKGRLGSNRNQDAQTTTVPLPTNAWYQNLLIGSVNTGQLSPANRAYTVPYILDFVGPVPGVRVQIPHVLGSDTVVQLSAVERHGLTLGSIRGGDGGKTGVEKVYTVDEDSPPRQLGLGLKWTANATTDDGTTLPTMRTQLIRDMPYVTMSYAGAGIVPVVASQVPLRGAPSIDGRKVGAGANKNFWNSLTSNNNETDLSGISAARRTTTTFRVEREVALSFAESDFTWLVFFSRPTTVAFFSDEHPVEAEPLPPGVVDAAPSASAFEMRVVEEEGGNRPIILRAALQNNCTTGGNSLFCVAGQPREQAALAALLRDHADTVPNNPRIRYDFPSEGDRSVGNNAASIIFDWGATSMSSGKAESTRPTKDLLMYALPHHVDSIQRVVGENVAETGHCSEGLHGAACLIRGSEWIMQEDLDGPPSFVARRPPHHKVIPALAQAVSKDISFHLPDYYMRGAGDTYFSGKMLAKLGRIIVIASELRGLAATPDDNSYDLDDPSERELQRIVLASKAANLPSDEVIASALARLRSGVEIWLNGTAEAKFIYDEGWGGVVNCGCLFNDKTESCDNKYPNCPTFSDPGLNFGNGFYNDHHFHYGYIIYAAAVVANYDLPWGRKNFQQVLLLIRDIANPFMTSIFQRSDKRIGSSVRVGHPASPPSAGHRTSMDGTKNHPVKQFIPMKLLLFMEPR